MNGTRISNLLTNYERVAMLNIVLWNEFPRIREYCADMRVRGGGAAAFGGADGVSADGEELEPGRLRLLGRCRVVRWPCVEALRGS